jgi:hypothetical protein
MLLRKDWCAGGDTADYREARILVRGTCLEAGNANAA